MNMDEETKAEIARERILNVINESDISVISIIGVLETIKVEMIEAAWNS